MSKTKFITYTALFTALVTVLTFALPIPIPNGGGYINFGDVVIFVCAALINPYAALIAGGIGSALADVILSYTVWAPASLIIKGLEGLVCGLVISWLKRLKIARNSVVPVVIGILSGAVVMLAGYYVATWIITSSIAVANVSLLQNLIQVGISSAVGFLLWLALKGIFNKYFKK